MPMDVDLHASSAQTIGVEQRHPSMFTTYSSPFHPYPLLRSRSRVVSDLALETHLLSNSSSSSLFSSSSSATTIGQKTVIPDLRPLRVAVMAREASSDLGRRVCQYEVPGGGVCRDKTCTDMHLSDLDPDDHETARYLIETMPDVLQTYDESEIADQLLQARQKKVCHVKTASQGGSATSTCSLEETVAEAISALVGSGS
ncbi:hypothetical protein DFH11DRAFT_1594301 [Phellopilus nigrolimitatus]|nr:hypothetical protein DFH11DRAFT_1594301 [Phellopilus nigrolimitatus]